MKRLISIAIAMVAAPAAADPDPVTAPGETIVITGLRLPRPAGDVPATVTVIDRAQLDRAPQILADDVLRAVPSLATFRRSSSLVADPTAQGLALRGLGPSGVSRALVLLDGVPQNDPFGGWVYWRAVPLLSIDRVEIAPGGASALFGDFGLGGVLQLISRPIEGDRVEAAVAGGSLRTGRAALRATTRVAGFGIALDGEALHSDGFTPIAPAMRGAVDHAAASDHGSAGVRVERRVGAAQLSAFGRWFDESLDAGTDHTTADVRAIAYGARAQIAMDRGVLDATAFGSDQLFRQERARIAPGRASAETASRQRTPSASQGASVAYTARAIDGHTLLAGADALRVEGTATDTLTPAMPSPTSLAERSAGGEQRFGGVFVQDAAQLGERVQLSAALRLDAWQNRDGHQDLTTIAGTADTTSFASHSDVQLDPRLGAMVHVTPELALRGSLYRAFRAPTLNELYRPFQVGTVLTTANPELGPETVWGAELGSEVSTGMFAARATGYWNFLDQPISNVTLDDPMMRQRQNLGAARVAGLELELAVHPTPRWSAQVAYTFAHAVVTSAPGHDDLIGKRLAQDPRGRATAQLAFDDPRIAMVTVEGRYTSPQFEDDLNTLVMGAYCVVDVMVARRLARGFTAFAVVDNLLDREYIVGRAGVDTIGAPRTVQLGLRFDSGAPR